jgi:acetyltransferase-like isoleucine patch superfamily enzyme
MKNFFTHPTAEIAEKVSIGKNTKIWHYAQIREGVTMGENCIVGKGTYIDFGVKIGDNVKIQNGCNVYHGASIGNGVFLGPGVILTNDPYPRSVTPAGTLKMESDWEAGAVEIMDGASLAAGVIVLPNVKIGKCVLIGAGSVVTKSIPDFALAFGSPAKVNGKVCRCGRKISDSYLAEEEEICKMCIKELPSVNKNE